MMHNRLCPKDVSIADSPGGTSAKVKSPLHRRATGKRPVKVLTLALASFACACGGSSPSVDPQSMSVVAAAPSLVNDGSWLELSLEATDALGKPGAGLVSLSATHGSFQGFKTLAQVTLENGRATVDYGCDVSLDYFCRGPQIVSAKWNGLSSYAIVELVEAAGSPDAGS